MEFDFDYGKLFEPVTIEVMVPGDQQTTKATFSDPQGNESLFRNLTYY